MQRHMQKASKERVARLKAGITGRQVAEALGVSHAAVYFWETGKRTMPEEYRKKLREFLLKAST